MDRAQFIATESHWVAPDGTGEVARVGGNSGRQDLNAGTGGHNSWRSKSRANLAHGAQHLRKKPDQAQKRIEHSIETRIGQIGLGGR